MQYIYYPEWLKPEIFSLGSFSLRWYSFMYLVAFGITYLLFMWQVKTESLEVKKAEVQDLFFYLILGLMLGARLFSTLFYSGLYYWQKPWLIFWPFREGQFTGFAGLSYHGGLRGLSWEEFYTAGNIIGTSRLWRTALWRGFPWVIPLDALVILPMGNSLEG